MCCLESGVIVLCIHTHLAIIIYVLEYEIDLLRVYCGIWYAFGGMMHIKEPLLLIGKSSQSGGSGFPLSLSEWSSTLCLTPCNRR